MEMLDKNTEMNKINESEIVVAELEIEELEQRLEMTCTRCCADTEVVIK
jgi:hypothetical protein